MTEHMRIMAEDATDHGDRQPIVRIVASVEVSGEWVSQSMIAYAARQFARTIAGKLEAAADEAPEEHDPAYERGWDAATLALADMRPDERAAVLSRARHPADREAPAGGESGSP